MRLRSALAALAAATLGACGSAPADLFVVTRTPTPSGGAANAVRALTLVAVDDGSVTCNGHRAGVPNSFLLQGRQLQRDLQPLARQGLRLPAGPRPVYTYSARTPDGSVAFADDSPAQPAVFARLVLFTLQVDRLACRRASPGA